MLALVGCNGSGMPSSPEPMPEPMQPELEAPGGPIDRADPPMLEPIALLGTCGEDEIDVPGAGECLAIAACEGEFASGLPADAIYVRPSGTGDGSRERPFGSIAAAIAVARAGRTIALAQGRYAERVRLPAGVALRGACATGTVIVSPGAMHEQGAIQIERDGTSVSGVRVEGRGIGVWAEASASLDQVIVAMDGPMAVATVEGELTIARSIVHNQGGYGVLAEGGTARVERSLLSECEGVGAGATLSGHLVLAQVAITDIEADSEGDGFGVVAQTGSTVEASSLVIERSTGAGVHVAVRATVTLEDAVVRDTRTGSGGSAQGMTVNGASSVTATRVLFEHNKDSGVFTSGSFLALTDVVIRDTASREGDGEFGRGLELEEGTTAELTRLLLEHNHENGLFVAGTGTVVTGSDVSVVETIGRESDGLFGVGATWVDGANVELARVVLDGNTETGLIVRRADARIGELLVQRTHAAVDGFYGRGIDVESCSTGASSDPSQTLRVNCGESHLALEHVEVADSADIGIRAFDPFTSIIARDLVARDTQVAPCHTDGCAGDGSGMGIGAYGRAEIVVERFLISRSALCGVQVGTEASIDLSDGVVAMNPIGANVQNELFDPERIARNVAYLDNEVTLDATKLPVPSARTR